MPAKVHSLRPEAGSLCLYASLIRVSFRRRAHLFIGLLGLLAADLLLLRESAVRKLLRQKGNSMLTDVLGTQMQQTEMPLEGTG